MIGFDCKWVKVNREAGFDMAELEKPNCNGS